MVECVRASLAVADFIEINESCPNVHHGGGGGGGDATAELRARLRDVVAVRDEAAKGGGRRVPILVKLGDLGDARATVKFLAGREHALTHPQCLARIPRPHALARSPPAGRPAHGSLFSRALGGGGRGMGGWVGGWGWGWGGVRTDWRPQSPSRATPDLWLSRMPPAPPARALPRAPSTAVRTVGIDGVVALNTQKDYALFDLPPVDRAVLEHYTERYGGGLSGPPILARSTEQVAAARAAVRELRLEGRFTVVHVGGVQTVADVQSSRATGAELRQWYTGLMHGLAQRDPLSLYARVAGGAR